MSCRWIAVVVGELQPIDPLTNHPSDELTLEPSKQMCCFLPLPVGPTTRYLPMIPTW